MNEMDLQEQTGLVYLNPPQLLAYLVDANEEYHVWGRGTGKTSGVLAPKSRRNLVNMPRATGATIGETYQQLLTRTLPSRISGWEKFGFIRDIHYVIGKQPPKEWPRPFEPPVKLEYFISVINGAGMHLVSQDRVGSSNGLNIDWIDGDEVKFIDYQRFMEETFPAMRANRTRYGHLSYHHSICFTTSMPTAADAKWILKKEEQMDREQIDLILAIQREVIELQQQIRDRPKSYHKAFIAKIRKYQEYLNELRKDAVYYSEASTLENIHVLGEKVIRGMKRSMPDYLYRTEVLNIRPDQVEGGFYPNLNVERHAYVNYNLGYLESLNYDLEKIKNIDCRQDADLIAGVPLYAAVDWGAKINCITTGQHLRSIMEVRYLSGLFVKRPEYLDHLARKWGNYYRFHNEKTLYLAYDHTGNTQMANSNLTYAEQFAKIIREEYGWNVQLIGKSHPPTHQQKYLMWARILKENDANLPVVRFNKNNCKELIISMLQAPAEDSIKGIRKGKNSERNDNIPQEEATHFSDAADIMLDAIVGDIFMDIPDYIGINISST